MICIGCSSKLLRNANQSLIIIQFFNFHSNSLPIDTSLKLHKLIDKRNKSSKESG